MKKSLLIIIILVIVAVVVGFLAVKFLGGTLSGPMGGKSLMDIAKEQGEKVPSEKEAITECEKSSDQESKDFCYNMIAYSYRDASLCKRIKDSEIKKECNKEKIEGYYKSIESGMPGMPGMPGAPGMPERQNEETENIGEQEKTKGPAITREMNDDIWVEAMAYSTYFGQLIQARDMVAAKKLENKMKIFYQESGVTGEKINAYMEANPEKVARLMQRVNQRVAELQKTGL